MTASGPATGAPIAATAPVPRALAERLADAGVVAEVRVPGVSVVRLPVISDARGSLGFAEYDAHIPFVPRRFFAMFEVPAGTLRGDHAHRRCHQFFVCLRGACTLRLDDGTASDQLLLETPALGVHAPPLTWCTVRLDLPGTVVLVLASDAYDRADYILDYAEFLSVVSAS